jgi:hypothetical protein
MDKEKKFQKPRVIRGVRFGAVRLREGEACGYRRHFLGLVRDVLGYLDLLAGNDPERFVYCRVDDIILNVGKKRTARLLSSVSKVKTEYKRREIEYVLTYLRREWIISGAVARFRNGLWREGRIVAPHDAIFHSDGKTCQRIVPSRKSPDTKTKWALTKDKRGGGHSMVWKETSAR